MCRIVFWNLKRKDLTHLVCELALETKADVLVLNECSVPIEDTLSALTSSVDRHFFLPDAISNDRFHCFCRQPSLDLTEVHKGFRTSFRKLNLEPRHALLGLVHGVDIRNYDSENRQAAAQSVVDDIRFVRGQQGHNRFILIGDFNMNPYDRGMNVANGYNAMMTRACVAVGQRTFLDKRYDLYYNPMWSLLGDGTEGPAGTVYDTSNQGPYGWSMLDQVIINHALVDEFQRVRILSSAGSNRLTNEKGRPDSGNASDHLPILVELKGIVGD